MVFEKKPQGNDKLLYYKKQCLPVITWNKKQLLKQVIPITFTLGKKFFAAAAFESF